MTDSRLSRNSVAHRPTRRISYKATQREGGIHEQVLRSKTVMGQNTLGAGRYPAPVKTYVDHIHLCGPTLSKSMDGPLRHLESVWPLHSHARLMQECRSATTRRAPDDAQERCAASHDLIGTSCNRNRASSLARLL